MKLTMVYFILKTRVNPESPRIFYVLNGYDVPEDEHDDIIHLKCNSVRRLKGITQLLEYLQHNTSNAMHKTEPYIIKKISWNEALDMFGLDYDTEQDEIDSE